MKTGVAVGIRKGCVFGSDGSNSRGLFKGIYLRDFLLAETSEVTSILVLMCKNKLLQ